MNLGKIHNANWKKSLKMLLWTTLLLSIMLAMYFAIGYHQGSRISSIEVRIDKWEEERNTITKEEVLEQIKNIVGDRETLPDIQNVKLREIEDKVLSDNRIESAVIYIDGRNILNCDIVARKPIVRIKANNNEDYYLDVMGNRIDLKKHVAARVPVVTGSISAYEPNWAEIKGHRLHEVLLVAREINNDDFLSALIEQIDVSASGNFKLIPKIGKEKINLGYVNDLEIKLENLKATFKHWLPKKEGWGKYKELNLEIPNQAILES